MEEDAGHLSLATDNYRGERKRCFRGLSSPSFNEGGDSPRSANSANSFETLASTDDLLDDNDGTINAAYPASAASAAAEGDGNGRTKTELGVVDKTLFESWKELPWQARVCPRAIEDQEVVRRTAALKTEVSGAPLFVLAGWLRLHFHAHDVRRIFGKLVDARPAWPLEREAWVVCPSKR